MVFSCLASILLLLTLPLRVSPAIITVKEGISAEHREEPDFDVSLFKPLVRFNKVNFDKSVLNHSNNGVRRWAVLFCLDWFDTCAAFDRPFMEFATGWEGRLNIDLLSTEVRFATVDCATDRVLCNEQGIHQFPNVVLYQECSAMASWTSTGSLKQITASLISWGYKHFNPILAGRSMGKEGTDKDVAFLDWAWSLVPGRNDFGLDMLSLISVMAFNAWVVSRNPELRPEFTLCKAPKDPAYSAEPQSIARFLPKDWVSERPHIEL